MINLHEKFYHLSADPFRLSSDYRFSFAHKSYTNAIGYLKFALHSEEGFIVITGRPGTGKTTLINEVVAQLDAREVEVATLVTTAYEAEDLLHMIASAFKLRPDSSKKSNILLEIENFLRKKHAEGKRVLLIVDEAQGLRRDAVEELRLLSNLQVDGKPLLQTFLIGQEEFRNIIELPEFEQLRQRVIASSHLEALSEDETSDYIVHRLEHAGWKGDPSITRGVVLLVHHFSGGVPRIINLICGRLLFHGCMEEKHALNAEDMKSVLNELSEELLVIDSVSDLSEIADRLDAAEQELIQPSLPNVEPLQAESEQTTTGEGTHSARLGSASAERVEEAVEETLYVLNGNALKKASDPEGGAVRDNVTEMKLPKELTVVRGMDGSSVSDNDDDDEDQPLAPQHDTGQQGDRQEASSGSHKKAGGRTWLALAVSGVLVAVLLTLVYLYQQDASVDQVSQAETKTLEKPPVAAEPTDVEKLPASKTLESRIQKQSKAISIIKGIDFSAYESKETRPPQDSGSDQHGRLIGQAGLEIPPVKPGSGLSNKKVRQNKTLLSSGNPRPGGVFHPGTASRYDERPSVSATMNSASTRAANNRRLPAISPSRRAAPVGRTPGPVADAPVVAGSMAGQEAATQTADILSPVTGFQGVDGFGPDKQRKYLFEGKWVGEKSKADFLPSDKVFCKDFYKYVSCWSVPEYTKSSTGDYKQVVESTLSGFTGKGAFTVTSRIKKISIDNQRLAKGIPSTGSTIVTRNKRCVFIDQNYITCGAEQGGIEKYTRTSL